MQLVLVRNIFMHSSILQILDQCSPKININQLHSSADRQDRLLCFYRSVDHCHLLIIQRSVEVHAALILFPIKLRINIRQTSRKYHSVAVFNVLRIKRDGQLHVQILHGILSSFIQTVFINTTLNIQHLFLHIFTSCLSDSA